MFPVKLFGGIGAPHLEEVYALYAGFFFGRFSGQSEAQRIALAREGAFKIIAVIGDPNFFPGGFVVGVHKCHLAAEKQAVDLFG